jgi:hypothetical protein
MPSDARHDDPERDRRDAAEAGKQHERPESMKSADRANGEGDPDEGWNPKAD